MSEHWPGHGHGPWSGPPGFSKGKAPRRIPRRFFLAGSIFFLALIGLPTAIGMYLGSRTPGQSPRVAIVVAVVVMAALLVGSARVFGGTFRSTRQLITATGRLADGDYSTRVTLDSPRSLAALIRSFNAMAERLESEDVRRRRLLADIGHELRTPLTVLQARVEAMIDGVHLVDENRLSVLLTDIATMDRLLEDLRTLSLSQAGALQLHVEPTDLDAITNDLAAAYRTPFFRVDVVGATGMATEVDPVRIRQVLTNLLNNAVAGCGERGRIEIRLGLSDDQVSIEIVDDGRGIASADLDHVFDRFHTGDTASGSGIGLTLARELVQAHGGSISIESVESEGTAVTVMLPTDGPEAT